MEIRKYVPPNVNSMLPAEINHLGINTYFERGW